MRVAKGLLAVIVAVLIPVSLLGCGKGEVAEAFAEDASETAYETNSSDGVPADGENDFRPLLKRDDYLSTPPLVFTPEENVQARGIYMTSNSAGIPDRLDNLAAICAESGMNAVVIDIRTENEITMTNWIDFADEWGVSKNFMPDIEAVMTVLDENGIYPIARMVTFLDGYTAEFRPELYIHNKDGSLWAGPVHNGKRYPWLNPYNRETWDYVLTYAKAAAELGFKEIQFDYVRFAATSSLEDADFGETGGLSRTEVIAAFLQYAKDELRPYKVKISADVYGTIINSDLDAGIVGQDYATLARILDAICPMVYPSHFASGTFGIAHPDTEPYDMIYQSMLKSTERLSSIPEEERAVVRPWLQDFTASWVKPYLSYGAKERAAQIQAVYDAGLTEWLLWDPGNRYEADGFIIPE